MLFWTVAAVVTIGSLLLVFAPLLRGAGPLERRASYDVQIYRDQLREIDRDAGRFLISPQEAEDSRVEISRKLLAAADAEAREKAAAGAPLRATRLALVLVGCAAIGITGWLYLVQGAPGYSDQPLAARLASQAAAFAERPGQAEVEAMLAADDAASPPEPAPDQGDPRQPDIALVDQLQAALEARPDDLEGHRLLVRAQAGLGRLAEARRAQERVIAIVDDEVTADDLVLLAELMIGATNGYVSPEAQHALSRALTLAPHHRPARYLSGLTSLQGGRPDLAYGLWAPLLDEGPPDAPWVQAIEADIAAVAALAGQPLPGAGVPAAEPPPADLPAMAAGAPLPELDAETQTRIESMVSTLGVRLATEGGAATDWARLIRSLGVLGRIGDAATIWEEARASFAEDPAALVLLEEAAREARLTN